MTERPTDVPLVGKVFEVEMGDATVPDEVQDVRVEEEEEDEEVRRMLGALRVVGEENVSAGSGGGGGVMREAEVDEWQDDSRLSSWSLRG